MNESGTSQPGATKTNLTDIKDRLKRIETLLKQNQELLKQSKRSALYYYFSAAGFATCLTAMAAGMALSLANPDYSTIGLVLFLIGFIGLIVVSFLRRKIKPKR